MRKFISNINRSFDEKGIRFENEFSTDLGEMKADPDRLRQILINLLSNAMKYTPTGGVVLLKVQMTQQFVQFQVIDNGIGISPEHLPHIFTRFYRADKSRARSAGGSGIGLTITKHLVEAHGGTIQAFSAGPGKGSKFTFTIPMSK